MTFIVRAPAKINLHLRILGLRPDGYHEVLTLLQSLHLHDTLTFRPRPGPLTIHCRNPQVPAGRANLAWKAASVLWEALGRRGEPAGAAVAIRKRIPAAAGLAGGSSDAAAALRGLCTAWSVPAGAGWLHGLASEIGSDVPYFLNGGAAVARGRGERIRRVPDIEPLWVVLARPPFGVATADAYRWFDSEQPRRSAAEQPACMPRRWRQTWQGLRNDLQPMVARRHPEVAFMVERLERTGALAAAMTGSGSVVYGLYRREPAAAAARLAVRRRGWRTILTRTTGHTEFTRQTAAVPPPG
ncbi:MAG: 4-(cytidine 5'-diphospho)-2-C-methyl-D-erythritol kinase [Acidobacteria bacterium]|nr:4-(cytidine 5'-diphospho)-2-C-methyl-D-erythritol kinase [Acidobacteriota bacterium]